MTQSQRGNLCYEGVGSSGCRRQASSLVFCRRRKIVVVIALSSIHCSGALLTRSARSMTPRRARTGGPANRSPRPTPIAGRPVADAANALAHAAPRDTADLGALVRAAVCGAPGDRAGGGRRLALQPDPHRDRSPAPPLAAHRARPALKVFGSTTLLQAGRSAGQSGHGCAAPAKPN